MYFCATNHNSGYDMCRFMGARNLPFFIFHSSLFIPHSSFVLIECLSHTYYFFFLPFFTFVAKNGKNFRSYPKTFPIFVPSSRRNSRFCGGCAGWDAYMERRLHDALFLMNWATGTTPTFFHVMQRININRMAEGRGRSRICIQFFQHSMVTLSGEVLQQVKKHLYHLSMKHLFSSTILFCSICFLAFLPLQANAERRSGSKPQWVRKGESSLNDHRTNDTYYFKVIGSLGNDLHQLRQGNIQRLVEYIGTRNHIEGLSVTEMSNLNENGRVSAKTDFSMVFKNEFSSDVFYASLVDEYWEEVKTAFGGYEYQYYALYAVSSDGGMKPDFDRFEVTRSYGAAPAVMSIIPGVGQLYKGQKLKGCLMLGGAVVGAGAIILCENRRSYYQTRIIEQPKFARDWNERSNNWETGRNISIGVTGALMVWSIIDAAIAPGVTRIKISPSHSFAFCPTALPTSDGMAFGASLAYQF